MAKSTRLQFACVLVVLFLISHQQDLYVQGRHLKCSKAPENIRTTTAAEVSHGGSSGTDHDHERKRTVLLEYEEDGFRPTSPGHSPGVGHSINN
ncbi:hypothetical protein SESBI_18172 [Sesbania bispinosa]|nr:hypothetical protein SESBI_18172 [Sesbania bispinosa]